MSNILDTIVERKRLEVASAIRTYGAHVVDLHPERRCISMTKALKDNSVGIIAEFKRRSPSKGDIRPMAEVSEIVPGYERNGAAACSVLTDTRFFGGSCLDLMIARELVGLPLLRKDFIVHPRQIEEARAIGADAVLVIAAITPAEKVVEFTELAHSLGMEVIFEIHNEKEIDRFYEGVDIVGVNNRDLTTFETDPRLSEKMMERLPGDTVKIAESGLTDLNEVKRLRQLGYSGFLIGETFMKHEHPEMALKAFLEEK